MRLLEYQGMFHWIYVISDLAEFTVLKPVSFKKSLAYSSAFRLRCTYPALILIS